jgi:hypothetical protein
LIRLIYGLFCGAQPNGLKTREVDAGLFFNASTGLMGLVTKPPLQFGHWLFKIPSTQCVQKVHSKEQMCACVDSGGKSILQHSQLGLNANIRKLLLVMSFLFFSLF